jgi:hypothetical protein
MGRPELIRRLASFRNALPSIKFGSAWLDQQPIDRLRMLLLAAQLYRVVWALSGRAKEQLASN